MNATEIMRMAFFEKQHWWYCGLRDMIRRTLESRPVCRHPRVLDAGCGTGGNLRLLRAMLDPSYIGGFDVSPVAVDVCRGSLADADVYVSDLCDPELHVDELDLVLSCDVITIPGINNCVQGLAKIAQRIRRGGTMILNLPAYQWLYSEHDAAVGTRQRVRTEEARRLLQHLGLKVELVTYRVFSLFPAVVAARLPSMLLSGESRTPRSDLKPVRPWLNGAFSRLLSAENRAIASGVRWPWGSSVFAVGRKTDE
jgi:SAM-dependent methyltransferase